MSQQEYDQLVKNSKVLEGDTWGLKVLETSDNKIHKIFRLKRLLSSAYFFPYAIKFKTNAQRLKKKGIVTVDVEKIVYCRAEQRHVLTYKKLSGETVNDLLAQGEPLDDALIKKVIVYIAKLHKQGIYFRALHFGNILVQPNGQLALIDISDMQFRSFPLTGSQRIRNWRHLLKYDFEKSIINRYGWDKFFGEYMASAEMSEQQLEQIKAALVSL